MAKQSNNGAVFRQSALQTQILLLQASALSRISVCSGITNMRGTQCSGVKRDKAVWASNFAHIGEAKSETPRSRMAKRSQRPTHNLKSEAYPKTRYNMDDIINELGTKNLFFCQSATIHSEEIGAITEKCISKKIPIFHVVNRSIVRQHPRRVLAIS